MFVYTIVSNSSNSGVALTVGEKGVALIVGETTASHLTPLHAPVSYSLGPQIRDIKRKTAPGHRIQDYS